MRIAICGLGAFLSVGLMLAAFTVYLMRSLSVPSEIRRAIEVSEQDG